jgi:type I restriction enzyme, S subunit
MIVEPDTHEFPVSPHWESRTLGELADQERGITYGIVQPGQNIPDGVPIIRVQNIVNGTLDTSDVMRVSPEIAAKYQRTCLRGGELLLSLVGSVGSSVIAPPEVAGWNTARAVAVVPLRPDVDARYIRFCLRSAPLQHLMEVWCNTTVQATLNLADVSRLPIPIPPKQEREAIVKVLGALDDKIELNRRMNRTLEELATTLFRSWFVDFDPVVAKAAGRKPVHLRAELAALFPAHFQESELGPIPQGWRVARLANLCTTQYGYTATATDEPVGPKFLRVTDINKQNWVEWDSVPHCVIPEKAKAKYALQVGDLVVARMADPGKSAIIEEEIDAVFASYLVRLKAHSLRDAYYVYGFLKSDLYLDYAESVKTGSVQSNMNANVIVAADVVLPPENVLSAFLDFVLPLRKKIIHNVRESRTLAALRDTLLPKLLSGELRVKQAEKLLAAVS